MEPIVVRGLPVPFIEEGFPPDVVVFVYDTLVLAAILSAPWLLGRRMKRWLKSRAV